MATPITMVSGIGTQTAEILVENGFESAEALAAAKEDDLLKINGFGLSRAKKIIEAAQVLMASDSAEEDPVSEQPVQIDVQAESSEEKVVKPAGPKICTQKLSKKAKKKKDKGGKANNKKKKSSRKKKSK